MAQKAWTSKIYPRLHNWTNTMEPMDSKKLKGRLQGCALRYTLQEQSSHLVQASTSMPYNRNSYSPIYAKKMIAVISETERKGVYRRTCSHRENRQAQSRHRYRCTSPKRVYRMPSFQIRLLPHSGHLTSLLSVTIDLSIR